MKSIILIVHEYGCTNPSTPAQPLEKERLLIICTSQMWLLAVMCNEMRGFAIFAVFTFRMISYRWWLAGWSSVRTLLSGVAYYVLNMARWYRISMGWKISSGLIPFVHCHWVILGWQHQPSQGEGFPQLWYSFSWQKYRMGWAAGWWSHQIMIPAKNITHRVQVWLATSVQKAKSLQFRQNSRISCTRLMLRNLLQNNKLHNPNYP